MNAPSVRYTGIHGQEQSDNDLNNIASDDEFQKNCLRYSWDGGITAELSRQMPSFLTAYVYAPPTCSPIFVFSSTTLSFHLFSIKT